MGFDPNEPRDKSGKWTGAASGHNAGGGNRAVADHIKKQLSLESIPNQFGFKTFKIKSGDKVIGKVNAEAFGTRVQIHDVKVKGGSNSLGLAKLSHLARELKKQFPTMETVSGLRASGSKHKSKNADLFIEVKTRK